MRPPSGRSAPAMRLNSVVLPEPFGPITPSSSPACRVKPTSRTARTPPKPFVSRSTSRRATAGPRVAAGSALGEGRRRVGQRRGGRLLRPHQLLLAGLPLQQRLRHDAGAVGTELHG